MIQQCPGQDGRSWSPDDVSEKDCPECGYAIEFFKFDLMRECPDCGKKVVNPRFNLDCAEWCDQAAICIGEGSTLYKEVQTIRSRIEEKIEVLFENQPGRYEHIQEVTDLADKISRREQFTPLTVILSALLHDLGSKSCKLSDLNLSSLNKINRDEFKNCRELARYILQDLDIPEYYQDEIMRNISSLGSEKDREANSYLVLKDAHRLALLKAEHPQKLAELDSQSMLTEGGEKIGEIMSEEVEARIK